MLHRTLIALTVIGLAPAVASQVVHWNIPKRGAAEFERRVTSFTVSAPKEDRERGIRRVIDDGAAGGHVWRYRQFRAGLGADDFHLPEYDASTWAEGRSPFGDTTQRTKWPADQRWLDVRTTIDLPRRSPTAAVLSIKHDDNATIWINGVKVYERRKFTAIVHHPINAEFLELFAPGENVIAARVENTGGAANFDLALTLGTKRTRDPAAFQRLVIQQAKAADSLRGSLFPALRAPRFLCQGQLTEGNLKIAKPSIDLRDLGMVLATDMTRATYNHNTNGESIRSWRFGDIEWRGRLDTNDAGNEQRIEVKVKSAPPDRRGDDKRFFNGQVMKWWEYTIDGTLVVNRRIDPDRGLVLSWDSKLDATLIPAKGGLKGAEFQLGYGESWKLKRTRDNRDSDFRMQVIDSIQRGAKYIHGQLKNLKSGELKAAPGSRSYNTGRVALGLLALIHAEVPRDDPVVQAALNEIRKRKLVDTYATANCIMAMEAYYAPRGELEELRSGSIDRPRKRQPSAADRKILQRWTNILMKNIDKRVDKAYLARWNYVPGARYDHSVNQYGLLGLYSAHLCGIKVPVTVWEGAINHLVDSRQKPAQAVPLKLTSYREWEREKNGDLTSSGYRKTKASGWGYYGPISNGVPQPIYGSMTCAGLTGLTIALAGLRDNDVQRARAVGYGTQALRGGFAWLADNFSVQWHPGPGLHGGYYSHYYYYLYGLERSCELSGTALINDRDWYFEGALMLMDEQHQNGSWPADLSSHYNPMVRTAMAVLFLKKSSMPVFTQK